MSAVLPVSAAPSPTRVLSLKSWFGVLGALLVVVVLAPLLNLAVPEGIRLVFQPPHSPELQPAEHLWAFVDEPLVNIHFATLEDLDRAVANRCVALMQQRDTIRSSTLFHWWPRQRKMK